MTESLRAGDGPQADRSGVPNTPVAAHMCRQVVVASVGSTPGAALQAMLASGQRHLVVVDRHGAFLGVLPSSAVAASTRPTLEGVAAGPAVQLSPGSSMSEAASLMMTYGVDAVGVLDPGGDVAGVLRWSDLIEMATGT